MAEYTTQDAVRSAMSGNVNDFRSAINDILTDRVRDAIDIKKSEVASTFMSAETDEVEVDDQEDGYESAEEIEGETDVDQEI
jgi:hypothetical protein